MFNLAIDSKLRACDVVLLKVEGVAPNGYAPQIAGLIPHDIINPVPGICRIMSPFSETS